MTINITKDVLNESKFCKGVSMERDRIGQNCAIGKAIFDLFGDLSWVNSTFIGIYKTGFTSWLENPTTYPDYEIRLPLKAILFISKFDGSTPKERANMKPFSFDVEIPDEVVELIGGVEEVYKILEESETMQLALV